MFATLAPIMSKWEARIIHKLEKGIVRNIVKNQWEYKWKLHIL